MSPTLKQNLISLLKGAIAQATSGSLYLEDLTDIRNEKARRASRNSGPQYQAKSSGHLTTQDAKRLKANREENELKKAQALVDRTKRAKTQAA
ncbi:MAG: hypothetical protein M1829_001559 [Trizodia sp. TS-e1964]|nr:MAG: hypothetical protein M1829_001559 [Trizodia sp. TS-e1964]